ncbi:Glycosyl transferase family 2 [Faunimonas pinastri]|uniref:Glycosyl transferase family 2 n=1 Tax=Faunimonas pinastri TaxID=1855383 RepID=A0A1H9KLW1_9HYPH|nr:glycosyltransferase family 2 protein [Faunimonas pinastri]SER00082.1 Glycosyl transferase family 2 [Faunimonas pinastri]
MNRDEKFLQAFGIEALPQVPVGRSVVAVVLCYNEVLRLSYFLDFHRSMGIEHFVVVDNNSDDGTFELLSAQPDVTVIRTANDYKEYKATWRHLIADRFFENTWVLFPDVDELFVYPGWPERKIQDLTAYLDRHGYGCLFTTMVDMYSDRPIEQVSYRPGQSFIETCPFFDGTGYRMGSPKAASLRRFPNPGLQVHGGPRERLFSAGRRPQNAVDRWVLRTFFSVHRPEPRRGLGRRIARLALKYTRQTLPQAKPVMSKIPLLKWQAGYEFGGGVHMLNRKVPTAPDWGALLHFKYLDDFAEKVAHAIRRGQHSEGSAQYRSYDAHKGDLMQRGAVYPGSRRFEGTSSLIAAGLMRVSAQLRADFKKVDD